ncbi:MopE-related protein [Sorangium sp. So ce1335]
MSDCNDSSPLVHPGAEEERGDGFDNNGDGVSCGDEVGAGGAGGAGG